MALPLLQTKFHIPQPHPHLIKRPKLIETLHAGIDDGSQLIFVSAPAGYGKTTLLSDWVKNNSHPLSWLTLDANDNDVTRFLAYLTTALQQIDDRLGVGLLESLQGRHPPDPETVLTGLINQINALAKCPDQATGDFILVLDDYQSITNNAILGAVAFLLEHQPANMHLVVTTRSDPPLPLARLRGMGLITELRQSDLRFTEQEARAFLEDTLGRVLFDEDVKSLTAATEGWPAGLQMAAVSMKDQEDISTFVAGFHGNDRYILDYLLEEVLHRQSPYIQRFLLQTAVLEQMSGPLCAAVVDDVEAWTTETSNAMQDGIDHGAQDVLEYLDAANLFILPLDNERHWYRYHHLFADLLRQRLQQQYPDLEPVLHGRASKWYEAKGMLERAVAHAAAASDFDRVSELIRGKVKWTPARSETVSVQPRSAVPPEEGSVLPKATVPTTVGAVPTVSALLEQVAVRRPVPAFAGKAQVENFVYPPAPAKGLLNAMVPTLPDPLSEREEEVLLLVAEGMSNREIADRLYVAISTVKTHINHIYRKLDVGNRTKAIVRARELGLV